MTSRIVITPPSRTTIVVEGVLAGTLVAFVETGLFWWSRDYALPVSYVARHVAWLGGLGLIIGVVSALRRSRLPIARVWFLLPSLLAVSPLLTRRLGLVVIAFVFGAALWWASRARSTRHESSVVGACAGAMAGVTLVVFLSQHYTGRSTAWAPLTLTLGVGVAALLAYRLLPRWRPPPGLDTARPILGAAVGITLLTLLTAHAGGEAIPGMIQGTLQAADAPPVVVIVLDTVRADHLSIYGYHRDTMPRLAEFARREIIVQRAITNAPDSLAAHASLFTGVPPPIHGAHRPLPSDPEPPAFGYPLRTDIPTLAERLGARGYATIGVSGNSGPVAGESGLGLDRGFAVYRSDPQGRCAFRARTPWLPLAGLLRTAAPGIRWLAPCRGTSRTADAITADTVALIDAAGESSFFLFVNYMDAHRTYAPPAPFDRTFDGVAPDLPLGDIPDRERTAVLRGNQDLDARSRRHLDALYDGELRYVDTHLERLLARLRRHPAWDDMLVVVTSDHGEALGEHRLLGHTTSLYDVMIRVPMILKFGRTRPVNAPARGERWEETKQLTDIAPMVLQHAGIRSTPDLPRLDESVDTAPPRAWSYPPLSLTAFGDRFRRELRSVEDGRWKLIEDSRGQIELYDLEHDPGERNNLAEQERAVVASMQARLGPNTPYRRVNRGTGQTESPETLERLRSLGYVR